MGELELVVLKCPCTSGKLYHECCKPYHEGTLPESALVLMRSRYAAYALGLVDYIIATTHPHHLSFSSSREEWEKEIAAFSEQTTFVGLTIQEFIDGKKSAWVTFTAHLKVSDRDVSFTEKSHFIKENGRWLYESGVMK